jgi:hypothetical protein
MCPEFMTVRPLEFCACPYGLYGFSCPENRAQHLPRFLCQLMLYDSLEMHANTLKKLAVVHLDFCAHLMLYGLFKSVLYGLFFLVVCCLEIRACYFLGMRALLLQMLSLFSSSTSLLLSLALSTRMHEQPKNGCAPLP